MRTLVIEESDTSSDEVDGESTCDLEQEDRLEAPKSFQVPSPTELQDCLVRSQFNWFEVINCLIVDEDGVDDCCVSKSVSLPH